MHHQDPGSFQHHRWANTDTDTPYYLLRYSVIKPPSYHPFLPSFPLVIITIIAGIAEFAKESNAKGLGPPKVTRQPTHPLLLSCLLLSFLPHFSTYCYYTLLFPTFSSYSFLFYPITSPHRTHHPIIFLFFSGAFVVFVGRKWRGDPQ